MKDFLKVIGIVFIGLFTSVIIYPILHETGHSLIAVLVGAEVVDFNIFPMPNVLCNVMSVNSTGLVAIGLGGIFIPYFVSFILKPKGFWGWYLNFIVRCISLLAIGISIVGIVMWINGKPIANEDISQVLNIFEGGAFLFLAVFVIMAVYGVIKIITDKPISRVSTYFGLN